MRERIAEFERKNYGAEWSTTDLVSGLMTDVGDLAAAIQRVQGRRPARDIPPMEELEHELGDCLWVLLVLAERFNTELDAAFDSTMVSIDSWLNRAADAEPDENPVGRPMSALFTLRPCLSADRSINGVVIGLARSARVVRVVRAQCRITRGVDRRRQREHYERA